MPRIAGGLTRIERAQGFLEAAILSEALVREMGRRALISESHHTTHIEGTRLTLEQAERLLEGSPVPEADPDDVRELLNYRKAIDFVSEHMETGGPMTEGLVREIHKRLVEGVRGGAAAPGEYRKIQNYVVNSVTGETVCTPPPAHDVPIMMAELLDWLNWEQDVHPVLVSGISQFQFVHIHPFLDGNGRTSRLLSTLCLYRAGYDFKRLFTISEHCDRDRRAFYRAIQSVRGPILPDPRPSASSLFLSPPIGPGFAGTARPVFLDFAAALIGQEAALTADARCVNQWPCPKLRFNTCAFSF